MEQLPTRYNPKETEDKWYKFWEDNNFFSAKPAAGKKPFCIVIPPPNVTGILHMGHALNNTVQDILIRYHRMKGEESLWMPGTDHAGIATQNVVEKAIAKEGLKRSDLGREKFIERVWLWREQYGSTIIRQLKKLGSSCDWPRTRFTMDAEYSRAVIEVFVRLYENGLIYQGDYIINWCPRCQTALSDEEAPHKEIEGKLYYLRYPFKNNPNESVTVATTRPETMLGDTAVAVNPKDRRYKKFVGKTLILPLVEREIQIIADPMVDMEFGTGAVKVTPAHDPNDYALGKKHKLKFINIMHPNGRLNENAGNYKEMDRFHARERILQDLHDKGLVEKTEVHPISAGHCYRCHTITEPYLSRQWFVKMKPLAAAAIEVVKKGRIKFYPGRWTKVYLNWMENIQDWCISRQIWWGHRLPVYYCQNCKKVTVARAKPDKCPGCGSADLRQDDDVLDTWFSSWLWPFATFYWPEARSAADLKYFYPTSCLVTAPEIIFFWVARMIMAGMEFMKDIPFRDVYIHGTVRDIEGKKMSKSLGNVIDPLEVIAEYGTDALRFSLVSITAQGQDVFLSKERFEQGRNFANKIWNAFRFINANLDHSRVAVDLCVFFKAQEVGMINRWILSRFYSTLKNVDASLGAYKFNEAVNTLYAFFWHEFCDWYLEIVKNDIKNPGNQVVMYKILEKSLRLLHPFMPFITEEIWQNLPHAGLSIMTAPWPHMQPDMIDARSEKEARTLFEVVEKIRNLRYELEIKPDQEVSISVYPHKPAAKKLIEGHVDLVIRLAKLEKLNLLDAGRKPAAAISDITQDADIYLHLTKLVDITREQAKIKEKILAESKRWDAKKKLTANPEFLKKAEKEVVESVKKEITELENKIARLKKIHDELQ
ncbi:MAG: valine--tRNA ligase [Deltaproteobacteria bacterium]